MAKLFNRVYVNTSTTGTGTVTLGSAFSNSFMTFAEAGVSNADVVSYCIEEGNDFEFGIGTYTSSGTTLSRDTVTKSKIAGTAGTSKMNLAGAATVRIVARKEDIFNVADPLTSAQVAAQSDQETATSTTLAVTPGRQQFHPSAPKCWGKANGAGTSLLVSYNITSITDTGSGALTVTIATDFSSANYSVGASIEDLANNSGDKQVWCILVSAASAPTAGAFRIETSRVLDNTVVITVAANIDPTNYYFWAMGDQ